MFNSNGLILAKRVFIIKYYIHHTDIGKKWNLEWKKVIILQKTFHKFGAYSYQIQLATSIDMTQKCVFHCFQTSQCLQLQGHCPRGVYFSGNAWSWRWMHNDLLKC
jgi:Tat protein secretion system quality control protein TatD with DNase activity